MDELSVQKLCEYLTKEAVIDQSYIEKLYGTDRVGIGLIFPTFLTETEINGRLLMQLVTEDYSEFKELITSQLFRKAAVKKLCRKVIT